MTVLPSPVPHPLEYFPLDAPRPALEAIEWVTSRIWPLGDETATWDVADRWYALAAALAEPHDAAVTAATEIIAANGDATDGFPEAWKRLAGAPDAPLNALPEIAHEVGELVEQCARDVEAAKLEALIEIGLFLTELTALSVTAPLTLGAATPAADGLIAATRITLQQLFDRLANQLAGQKPLPPATRQSAPAPPVAARTAAGRSESTTSPAGIAAAGSGAAVAAAAGRGPQDAVPDAAAGSPRRGRHARRETSESGRADSRGPSVLPTQRDADLREGPSPLPARPAAETRRPTGPAAAKSTSSDPSAIDAGPGTVTRRISPSELERPADAVNRRDKGDDIGHPRDAGSDGQFARLADPRVGQWFRLTDGGSPAADPGQGLHCLDDVLALCDTYLHGRPGLAAPRIFDVHAQGEPDQAVDGEWDVVQRIELAIGSEFQNLCPYLGRTEPAAAKAAVDAAMLNLANHLHNSGHGSFAFIVADLEHGGCHAWAAVNQAGDILFLDPQAGRISEDVPLYGHQGMPADDNIVSLDALVVDSQGRPAPLPFHGPGLRSGRPGMA